MCINTKKYYGFSLCPYQKQLCDTAKKTKNSTECSESKMQKIPLFCRCPASAGTSSASLPFNNLVAF